MVRHREKKSVGFTLIELMLVVAILSLLAAIATPKFTNMVRRAKEASVLGKLGVLRSTFSIYFADTEGVFPVIQGGPTPAVEPLVPKYIEKIPEASIPGYLGGTNSIVCNNAFIDAISHLSDPQTTPWAYFPNSNGRIFVNCSHTDSKGRFWSLY